LKSFQRNKTISQEKDSAAEFGILDDPHVGALLDNGVDKSVELSEGGNLLLGSLGSSRVGVKVGNLSEEVSTEAFVGLDEHAVLVGVVSGRGVLAKEGGLPDEVSLSALSRRRLLGLLVVAADEILHVTFNLDNVKHNAVGVAGEGALVVEKVVEGGLGKGSVLLLDFRDNNGVGGDGLGELGCIGLPVVGDRLG